MSDQFAEHYDRFAILESYSDLDIRYYYNKHTLYVKSGIATNEQLMACIKQSLDNVNKVLGKRVNCSYKANLIIDRKGTYYGYGYIWVTNTEVYNMLLGKNPDGSERIQITDDPAWAAPLIPYEQAIKELDSLTNWGEIMDKEDEIKALYTAPKITRVLPPLMTLPGYKYTEAQRQYFANTLGLALDSIPTNGHFHIGPATVKDPDDKYCRNVLCSRNIPEWINEKDLKNTFKVYATDSERVIERKIKKCTNRDTYPFVTINESRVAFITFDPNTTDAQFALLMTRKLTLSKKDSRGRVQSCLLVFDHSFRTSVRY